MAASRLQLLLRKLALSSLILAPEVSPAAEDAVERYLEAVSAIRSFDLLVRTRDIEMVHTTVTMEKRRRRDFPIYSYRAFKPGESGSVTLKSFRQVWESSGRRRVEVTPEEDSWHTAKVYDGEVVRTLETKSLQGAIHGRLPEVKPFLPSASRYDVLYSEVFLGGTYAELFEKRERPEVEEQGDFVHLWSPPQPGPLYPEFGFRLILDPSHNYLPNRIEITRKEELQTTIEIAEFHTLADGTAVPLRAVQDLYGVDVDQSPVVFLRTEFEVELEQSSWNEDIDEDEFTLPFPAGSRVRDDIRGSIFVVGEQDPGDNLEDLYEKSKKLFDKTPDGYVTPAGIERVKLASDASSKRRNFLALNVILVLAVCAIGVWRRRKKTTQDGGSK